MGDEADRNIIWDMEVDQSSTSLSKSKRSENIPSFKTTKELKEDG